MFGTLGVEFTVCHLHFYFTCYLPELNVDWHSDIFILSFSQADIGLPYPQRVVQLPEIVWDQYTNSLGNFEREFKNRKRHSRRVKLVFDKGKNFHGKN